MLKRDFCILLSFLAVGACASSDRSMDVISKDLIVSVREPRVPAQERQQWSGRCSIGRYVILKSVDASADHATLSVTLGTASRTYDEEDSLIGGYLFRVNPFSMTVRCDGRDRGLMLYLVGHADNDSYPAVVRLYVDRSAEIRTSLSEGD